MPHDFEQAFNFVEGLFWLAVGAGFLASLLAPKRRRMKLVAVLLFAVFGVSDFVEMQTGSWGHPWWLAVWKISCVLLMYALLMLYTRSRPRTWGLSDSGTRDPQGTSAPRSAAIRPSVQRVIGPL